MSEVTCRDCVHNTANWLDRLLNTNHYFWNCKLTWREPEYNPVNGTTSKGRYEGCNVARVREEVCGKDAKAWQPRGKNNFFVYLKRI